jgi:2-polyprenyl-3-methyl-5-hydroxy-6-metoxy-1,4-benzoquinol methylase
MMLITPEEFLKREIEEFHITYDNPEFLELTRITVEQVKDLDVVTILDYGAGIGAYSDAFHKAGYKVKAYEIWKAHRNYMKEKVPWVEITEKPITTDLMCFIETAEHMTDTEILTVFKQINPKYILFSSTSNTAAWDELWGHINLKQQEDWIKFFDTLGYRLIKELPYPSPWTKLFKYDAEHTSLL